MTLLFLWMQVFSTDPVDPRFGAAGAALSHDRPFGMPELSEWSASAAWRLGGMGMEAGISAFGFDLYKETRFRGGVGVAHGDLRATLLLETRVFSAAGFAPLMRSAVSAKARFPLTTGLSGGLLLDNLTATDDIPQVWAAGLSHTLPASMGIDLALHKDVAFPADARIRLRWAPHPAVDLHLGRRTQPARWSAGMRLRVGSMRFGFLVIDHPDLGWSQAQEVEWLW